MKFHWPLAIMKILKDYQRKDGNPRNTKEVVVVLVVVVVVVLVLVLVVVVVVAVVASLLFYLNETRFSKSYFNNR